MKAKRITVFLIMGLLIFFFFCHVFGFNAHLKLAGARVETEKPQKTWDTLLDGSYQSRYDSWFQDNSPFRDYLLKGYNQMKYSAFDKSANSSVVKGKRGVLFTVSYISAYFGQKQIDEQQIKGYVNDLAYVNQELQKKGKALVYLIAPSKPEVYPEVVPERYSWYNAQNETLKTVLIEELEKQDIVYFDLNQTMKRLKEESGIKAFPDTGLHWSFASAGLAMQELVPALNEMFDLEIAVPQIEIQPQKESTGEDQDIYKLLNLIQGHVDEQYYEAIIS